MWNELSVLKVSRRDPNQVLILLENMEKKDEKLRRFEIAE